LIPLSLWRPLKPVSAILYGRTQGAKHIKDAPRLDFDRKLKLEFHGTRFADPDVYRFLEAEGYFYAIRLKGSILKARMANLAWIIIEIIETEP
jgi:hypothetical protein